ncbi:MAG TPA: hypothetical protein VFU71_21500 [Burkholderiaceae bacterium]|nr:hypothetical protein [Burkholderiaceae bacterium]
MTRAVAGWLCAVALLLTGAAHAQSPEAASLRARHDALKASLSNSPFQRPLLLQGAGDSDDLKGEVFAVIDQPFDTTGPALQDRARWCDVLILHLNVKQCRPRGGSELMALVVGRKFEQPEGAGKSVDFAFRVASAAPDYVRVQMVAVDAPTDVKDQLMLEAAPLDDKRSFLRVSYAYSFSAMERFAMQAYLSTLGRDKVGFSRTTDANGQSAYVGGVRGMVERNVMRYYLAVVAYVESLGAPPPEQLEKRLRDWFAATEQHARQLHEMGRDEYLSMKRNETRGMR